MINPPYTTFGHSSKTTLLRRLAYDLSVEHDELVLYAAPDTVLRITPFLQLFDNTGKRIVLLVDNAADQIFDLERMCSDFSKHKIPITIILADTKASFGDRLDGLDDYIRQSRIFAALSENEIKALLIKLRETGSLGQLKKLSNKEQFKVFSELAQKQLLVALYEATQGRPLEELLVEEYHRILLSDAQQLYLLVATLHRFDIPVRAGLVSRAMGIRFEDFEKKFLSPLEGLIYTSMDYKSRDYVYRTRHPHIAEILFRRILDTQSLQIQQYARILSNLNPTYSSDDQALKNMLYSKSLRELTTSLDERRFLLKIADQAMPSNTFIIQQKALLEMNSKDGDFDDAEKLLKAASELSPHDISLMHTRATLLARRADSVKDPLRGKTLRAKSRELLKSLWGKANDDSYIRMSLAKLAVKDIELIIKQNDNLSAPLVKRDLLRLVEEAEREFTYVEKSIVLGPTVTTERAKLRRILKDNNKSVSIIEEALRNTPDSKRLAVAYNDSIKNDDLLGGRAALEKALISHPNDKRLNQALFHSLLEENDDFNDGMSGPLHRGFTLESDNIAMHINALRYHFIRGDRYEYERVLIAAKKVQLRLRVSNKPTNPVAPSALHKDSWTGNVVSIQPYFAFIKCPDFEENVFCASRFVDQDIWDSLVTGQKIKFDLEFNLKGAIATNLAII